VSKKTTTDVEGRDEDSVYARVGKKKDITIKGGKGIRHLAIILSNLGGRGEGLVVEEKELHFLRKKHKAG